MLNEEERLKAYKEREDTLQGNVHIDLYYNHIDVTTLSKARAKQLYDWYKRHANTFNHTSDSIIHTPMLKALQARL